MARTFHTDSRTWSNFQAAELVKLCGVPQGRWPVYVVKELLDNAVAALEEHGKKVPMVRVTLTDDYIEVMDNGPGISDSVLEKIIDFDRFGGSNRHHKLPTRGAQGNAFMTIVGIAANWLKDGFVELYRPCGPALSLEIQLDPIRQQVDIERVEIGEPSPSAIRVPLPELPWKRGGSDMDDVEAVVRQFAWLNPHVTFIIRRGDKAWSVPMDAGSGAALPGDLECGAVSWFSSAEFAERLAADVRARPELTLNEWAKEFAYAERVRLPHGAYTIDSFAGDSPAVLEAKAKDLRNTILQGSNVSKAGDPGFRAIGPDRLGSFLESEFKADTASGVEYHCMKGTFGDEVTVPYLVEVCLVQMPEGVRRAPEPVLAMNRTVLYGSPTFKNLTWREKVRGSWRELNGDLGALCRAYDIDSGKTPAAVVVHVTCPSPGYSGYGKQQFDTTWLAEPLSECFERVTLQIRKQRAGEARRKSANRSQRDTIRKEMFDLIPSVLHSATKGGKYPILIRQFYYAFRKEWYTKDDRDLHYGTFCAYVDEYEKSIGKPIAQRDARGTLFEPHSGKTLRLGTSDVDSFTPKKWEGHTIIFVEKENLADLMKAMKIGKRWDAIIIGSKGFAVESCREVLQKYRKLLGDVVKIVCLHDADPAGYMIGYDLANNLPRFGENVDVQLIDVGLTIAEANEMGLQDEPFDLKRTQWTMIKNMRSKFIRDPSGHRRPLLEPEAWDAFMPSMYRYAEYPTWAERPRGRRVELNAMEPEQFMNWVEGHLEANGCRKVRPPDEIVDEKLRTARENAVKNEVGHMLMRLMGDDMVFEVMREIGIPAYDLDAVLARRPEQHWEYLVTRAGQTGEDINAAVERVMRRRLPTAFKETDQ